MKDEASQTKKAIKYFEPDPLPSFISENTKNMVNKLL